MAQRIEKTTVAPKAMTPTEMQKLLADFDKLATVAKAASGDIAELARNKIDLFGLDRTALGITRRLSRMELSKRQATLRAIVEYASLAGFLDQTDAFDDLAAAISEKLAGRTPPAKADADQGDLAAADAPKAAKAPKVTRSSATVTKLVAKGRVPRASDKASEDAAAPDRDGPVLTTTGDDASAQA